MTTKLDKLNEKLALWAGLRFFPECECIRCKGICWGEDERTYGKDGKWHFVLPDFTLSLDACFKWLTPNFKYDVLLSHSPTCDEWHCDILGRAVYIGEEKTPALALCRAIEKLIDGEK